MRFGAIGDSGIIATAGIIRSIFRDDGMDLINKIKAAAERGYVAIIWAHRTPNGIPWFGKQFIPADYEIVKQHTEWKFNHTDAQEYQIMRPSEAENYRNSAADAMLESAGVVLA